MNLSISRASRIMRLRLAWCTLGRQARHQRHAQRNSAGENGRASRTAAWLPNICLNTLPGMPGAGRLKVRFLPSWLSWLPNAWGDYWILKLDRDYQVALVGTPDRQYLWLLSRAPQLDDATISAELEYARTLGFDVDRMVRSGH